jgi:putative transposase
LLDRSVCYYKSVRNRDDTVIRCRMKEIAVVRVRYWFWRIFTLLRREDWRDNPKRVHRLYCLEGLNLRTKCNRRNRAGAYRIERPELNAVNKCWRMDFVSDQLFDDKRFRAPTIVDNFSRKCHAIEIGQSLKGFDVVKIMDQIKDQHRIPPERIQVYNGSVFISKDFDRCAYENRVVLDYS